MNREEISGAVGKQRSFFSSGVTLSVNKRIDVLKKLRDTILKNESEIVGALHADLGKSETESYMCEIGMVLSEISHMLKHIWSYAKEKNVITPLAQFASRSFVKPSPYGTVLIMSPWNYPFLLSLSPLVDAVAAGNTVVLKPGAYSPHTSGVIKNLIKSVFPEGWVTVITGGREENACLLDEKFDYIFFTGSKSVGRYVLEKAAVHLTPVTLELGGKSPCIVHESSNLRLAAKRIVFGKFLNCGQTCVAPDYILCDEKVKDELIYYIKREIEQQYNTDDSFGRIINRRHFDRICGLIDKDKVVCGGGCDAENLKIEPTVMDNVEFSDAIMSEEIFGPVLPVLTFGDIDDAIKIVNSREKPLALYIFAEDKKIIKKVISECRFGGGCINDTVIHLATSHMGFGGVGESGMGAYHGKTGFETFSHQKSIVDKKTWLDLPLRYRPYKKINKKLIRIFLR